MSDNKLDKFSLQKLEMLIKDQLMPRKIIDVNFQEDLMKIVKVFPEKVIVIDFWALWCAPCKLFASIFEKAFKEYSSKFIFIKVNIDDSPEFAKYFGISSIPTILLVKGGEILRKFVGVINYETFKQILERFK